MRKWVPFLCVIAAAALPCKGIAVARDTQMVAQASYGVAIGRAVTQGDAYAQAASRVPVGASIYRRDITRYSGGVNGWIYHLYWKFCLL